MYFILYIFFLLLSVCVYMYDDERLSVDDINRIVNLREWNSSL